MRAGELDQLPEGLPVPLDDGAANHLVGQRIPSSNLRATSGALIDLSTIHGRVVVFSYPRTGRPNTEPLVADWDIWVPLRLYPWNWSASGTNSTPANGAGWALLNSNKPGNTNDAVATNEPTWTTNSATSWHQLP